MEEDKIFLLFKEEAAEEAKKYLGLTLEKKVKDNIKGKNPEQEKSISNDL